MGVIRSLFSDWFGARLNRSAFLLATIALIPFSLLLIVIGTNVSGRVALNSVHNVPLPWDVIVIAGVLMVPIYLAELNIAAKRALDIGLPPATMAVAKVAGPGALAALGFGGGATAVGVAALIALLVLPTNAARRKAS